MGIIYNNEQIETFIYLNIYRYLGDIKTKII